MNETCGRTLDYERRGVMLQRRGEEVEKICGAEPSRLSSHGSRALGPRPHQYSAAIERKDPLTYYDPTAAKASYECARALGGRVRTQHVSSGNSGTEAPPPIEAVFDQRPTPTFFWG